MTGVQHARLSELRYTLTGADKHGVFYEHRLDDVRELLKERDQHGVQGQVRDRHAATGAAGGSLHDATLGPIVQLYEVIDTNAVDPPERGVVTWCEGCLAEPVLERAGDESLCTACVQADEAAS